MSRIVDLMDEMANLIRDAITAPLYATQNIAVQVEPRMLVAPTDPCIDIYPAPDLFGTLDTQGFGDLDPTLNFIVRARVSTADRYAGQDILLAFMDPEDDLSVAVALDDDQTLNGLASSVYVTGPTGYTVFLEDSGTTGQGLIGCTWAVQIVNAKS